MLSFFNNFTTLEQIIFVAAIVCTVLFVIQLIMLIFGIGASEADFDISDVNSDGFVELFGLNLLSVRGIIGSVGMFSWTFLVLSDATEITWLSILIGAIVGIGTLVLIAYVMKKFKQMENDGNIDIHNCIDKEGEVYIPIPKQNEGKGKVNIVVQDRFVEFDAITFEEENLSTKSRVVVVDVKDNILIVKKK